MDASARKPEHDGFPGHMRNKARSCSRMSKTSFPFMG